MKTYLGNFDSWKDVVSQFTGSTYDDVRSKSELKNHPKPEKVYIAKYDIDGYEGSAVVIWRDQGKYYYLSGSHCSCYGLEEAGFDPEIYDSKELLLKFLSRIKYIYGLSDEEFKYVVNKISKDKATNSLT